MSEIKRFDEADWMAWAGAEKFPSGAEPLIYNQLLYSGNGKKVELTMIGDRYGVDIYLYDEPTEDGVEVYRWTMDKSMLSAKAEGVMEAMAEKLQNYTRVSQLTYALDHDLEPEFKDFEFDDSLN